MRIAQKNFGAAEKLIGEALEAHRESSSTAYREIGYLQTMLATVQMTTRASSADAEQTLRDTLVLYSKNIRGDHQYIASAEHYLGEALLAQHKYREAEVVLARGDGALEAHRRACLAFRAVSERTRRSAAWTRTNGRS